MILFGFPFTGKMAGDLLAECWQNGFVQAHPLTIKEIAYVCKYMYEKVCVPRFFGMKEVRTFYALFPKSRYWLWIYES